MTNQEKTQAVLEAVRNTKGLEHLKELSFGCRVELHNDVGIETINKEYPIFDEKITDGPYYTCLNSVRKVNQKVIKKIIGHPVQWSDVLVAIHIHRPGMTFVGAGEVIEWNGEEEIDEAEVKTFGLHVDLARTPEQNMLDNPDLTDFLYELLVKN